MDLKFKDNSKLRLAPFTQLEYIESTGTQYIDTGIKADNNNLTFKIGLSYLRNNQYIGSSEAYREQGTADVGLNSNNALFINWGTYTSSGSVLQSNYPLETLVEIEIKAGSLVKLNGNNTGVTAQNVSFTNGRSANFILNGTSDAYTESIGCSAMRTHYFIVENAGIEALHLIPVKDPNGVVCMYDTISKQFFYNSGTGDFIAGPVSPLTIMYLPEIIYLKTTTLYHKNTPNVESLELLNGILNYQKTHQEEIKEYYYPTTQLWQDIITEYPSIVQYYNMNHKLCVIICEADNPEQFTEDLLETIDDYPDIAPIIVEYPEVVHSLINTGYETWLNNNGTAYLVTQLSFSQGIRLTGSFYFTQFVDYLSIAGTYNGKHNILRVYQGPKLQVSINSNSTSTDKLEYNINLNTKYDLDLSNRASAYIKINGSTVASANFSGDIAPTPIAIFAITRYDSSTDIQVGTLKSSAIKLYDINDNIVLWLVPIQNNGNPCMIDLLTGTKYLNQGTGSFTYSLEPKNV